MKKAQCWEKHEKERSGCQLGKVLVEGESAKDISGIAERKDRDLMFFDRRFVVPKQTSGLQSAS